MSYDFDRKSATAKAQVTTIFEAQKKGIVSRFIELKWSISTRLRSTEQELARLSPSLPMSRIFQQRLLKKVGLSQT